MAMAAAMPGDIGYGVILAAIAVVVLVKAVVVAVASTVDVVVVGGDYILHDMRFIRLVYMHYIILITLYYISILYTIVCSSICRWLRQWLWLRL